MTVAGGGTGRGPGAAAGMLAGFDGVLFDLDGTVYRGGSAVPGAVSAVRAVQRAGLAVGYVTNNASRGPEEVAGQLTGLGFDAAPRQVTTSAQAGAALLAQRLPSGAAVLVVGTEALAGEVRAVGLTAVRSAEHAPAAVVQGHSPATGWSDLAEACLAVRAGALWVACNADPTLPTERGELPGNGAMVAALRTATGRAPLVAGKPQRQLLDQAAARLGMRCPLVVGDRLDTDIAGASAAGMAALLVLTGVSGAADLLAAPPELRPRFVAASLEALAGPAGDVEITEHADWQVDLVGGVTLRHRGDGGCPVDALRSLCAACWPAGIAPATVAAGDDAAGRALAVLGLARPSAS